MTMSPKTCMPYGIWHMGIMAVARTYALALGLRPLGPRPIPVPKETKHTNVQ